jgi:thymidine phosphorylase
MSQDVYSRISEKMKNEQFTEEEIKIVGKAKEQLSNYSMHAYVLDPSYQHDNEPIDHPH